MSTSKAPATYSQSSRKTKRAWRKNIDVSELQDGLDRLRTEQIQGGVVAEQPSESLFTLDVTPSAKTVTKVHRSVKPLRADQILGERSAIPAVDSRTRSSAGTTDGVLELSRKRKRDGVSATKYQALKDRASGQVQAELNDVVETNGPSAQHDPWASAAPVAASPNTNFIDVVAPPRQPVTLKRAPISLLADGKRSKAVMKPRPGTSYNPTVEEWESLLAAEGSKEVDLEIQRVKAKLAQEDLLARQAKAAAEEEEEDDELDLLNNDVYQTEEESAWEGFESESDGKTLKKKLPERKTPAERNKAKRRKEADRLARHEMELKKRELQEKRMAEIVREAKVQGKAAVLANLEKAAVSANDEVEIASSDSEVDDRLLRRKKFGNQMLPERHLELVLPDELQDSLRMLKPEGNLLRDRYRSAMVRGKIETRRRIQQPKKYKKSVTEKWGHKDFKVAV